MTPKPSFQFSFSFEGKIWQTALDENSGMLVLEIREADLQRISYQIIHLASGKKEAVREIEGVDWWTTILRFYDPVLLLERYNDPQNPLDKDLLLYHVREQRVLSVLDHFQFEEMRDDNVTGHRPMDRNEKITYDLSGSLRSSPASNNAKAVYYPTYFSPASADIQTVNDFIGLSPSGVGCEYFESGNYIIISYYVRLDRKFDRKLLVLKGDDELYHEIQDRQLAGFASGAFFLIENLLVFITNGNQINGIEL